MRQFYTTDSRLKIAFIVRLKEELEGEHEKDSSSAKLTYGDTIPHMAYFIMCIIISISRGN